MSRSMEEADAVGERRVMGGKLLYAKFVRAASTLEIRHAPVDYDGALLVFQKRNLRDRGSLFSGTFLVNDGTDFAFTFSIAFKAREDGHLISYNGNLAISSYNNAAGRVSAFLSLVDYLEFCEYIPRGTLAEHVATIKAKATNEARLAAVAGYDDFTRRAFSDMPYDLEHEVRAALGIEKQPAAA